MKKIHLWKGMVSGCVAGGVASVWFLRSSHISWPETLIVTGCTLIFAFLSLLPLNFVKTK